MVRGKPIPSEHQFKNPVKFSAVIDESTRYSLEVIAGELVPKFGYAPSQGQVVDFLTKLYFNNK